MAKQSGLGDNLYVGGYNLSGDINSISNIGGGPAAGDVTGIDKSAHERLGLLRDGRMEFTSYFNDATGQAHPNFSALLRNDIVFSYFRGTALGSPAAHMLGKQINYDPTRGADGSLTFNVSAQATFLGLQWGEQLTPGQRTDTAASNGTGVDFGASSLFGFQAYLHVFAFTGTSVTVKIQESSDNAVGDPFTDLAGGGFSAATGIGAQLITAGNATVERYLRVVTTGTFSNAIFAVSITRNTIATDY